MLFRKKSGKSGRAEAYGSSLRPMKIARVVVQGRLEEDLRRRRDHVQRLLERGEQDPEERKHGPDHQGQDGCGEQAHPHQARKLPRRAEADPGCGAHSSVFSAARRQ